MNILLIGEWYSDNLGDGVICQTVEKILINESKKNIKIYKLDISGKLSYGTIQSGISNNIIEEFILKSVLKNHMVDIKRADSVIENLKKYSQIKFDAAIFAGGQMFMDYFSIPIFKVVKQLSKMGIPISFNCCGIGVNNSRIKRSLLKIAINNKKVKYISVRDNIDEFKRDYLKRKDIEVLQTYDPALSLINYYTDKQDEKIKIGIGVINPHSVKRNGLNISIENMLEKVANIIREVEKQEIEWQVFTNGSTGDYEFAENLLKILGFNLEQKLAKKPKNPEELINLISKYEDIISFRLHSHIIAYSLGKKTLGIIWDKKVKEFGEIINSKDNFIEFEDENLYKKIRTLVDSSEIDNIHRDKLIKEAKQSVLNILNTI